MIRLALPALLAACRATGEFHCESDEQCQKGSEIGFCENTGYCTLTDLTCPTHRRYEAASAELDGTCLEGVVTGRIIERRILNDDTARPIVEERIRPAAEVNLSVLLQDGGTPAVKYRERDGVFSFSATGRYELHYTHLEDHWLQHDAPHLELAPVAAGRLDRVAVTKATTLQFIQTPQIAGMVFVASTGIWTESMVGNSGPSTSFNWQTAQPLSGDLGLLDGNKHDRLYFLMFGQLDGYATLSAHAQYTVMQNDGTSQIVAGALNVVTNRDQCVQVMRTPVSDVARLKMVHDNLTVIGSTWLVYAIASPEVPPYAMIQLASDSEGATVTDGVTSTRFVNPIPGTSLAVAQATTVEIPIAKPGAGSQNFPLITGSLARIDSADASCITTANLGTTTAIAGSVKMGPTKLDADETMVTLQNGAYVDVSWDDVVNGRSDTYVLLLYELLDDGNGGTTIEVRAGWETAARRAFVPKTMLVSGHSYFWVIYTGQEFENAGQGDYLTESPVLEVIPSASHTFTIL